MATGKTGSRRGFVFTMMALAILTFMLLSMQVWIRSFERSDENSVARFKGEAIRLVLSSLSDAQLSRFANASAYYATFKLANYSSYNNIADREANDTKNPGTGKVEQALRDLIVNGSAKIGDSANEWINYTDDEKQAYTITAWKGKVNDAANLMGFATDFSDPKNLTVRQLDPWTVGVSFLMQMNVTDLEGTMRQSKMMNASTNFSIDGFYDPSITRNDFRQRRPAPVSGEAEQKQIFRHLQYAQPSDVAPPPPTPGSEGNGWFAGPATDSRPGEGIFTNFTEQARMWQYIYVTNYYTGVEDDANHYGAVILTENPVEKLYFNVLIDGCRYNITNQTRCLNCKTTYHSNVQGCAKDDRYDHVVTVPYIAAGGFSLTNFQPVVRANMTDLRYVLINNEFRTYQNKKQGDHGIWDLTKIRDMSICGFYVKSNAPSFFQRMLMSTGTSTPGAVNSSAYGIETLLLSASAGGWLDTGTGNSFDHDMRSRVDWEFYSSQSVFPPQTTFKIKGMAGCRNEQMCQGSNTTAISDGVGKFWLTDSAISRYGIGDIACNPAHSFTGNCEPYGN
ncbi:MAG: hypothetical protein WCT52_03830 [Candidatus Micrarchaeia archaeon]